ncbi:MAG: hypothetical protein ABI882_20940, partial [Acidobacteriota bacterium]
SRGARIDEKCSTPGGMKWGSRFLAEFPGSPRWFERLVTALDGSYNNLYLQTTLLKLSHLAKRIANLR